MADKNPDEVYPADHWLHLWSWFWHLDGQREDGMNGPQPLSYLQLDAWQRLTGEIVRREEIKILLDMDRVYLSALRHERAEQQERREKERSNG